MVNVPNHCDIIDWIFSVSELFYEMDCGCKIKQSGEGIKDYDGLPCLEIDWYNISLDCPYIWELAGSGRTRGVFQLKSNLGRGYSKKLAPTNIDHISALTAILRPGCVSGDTLITVIIDRKKDGGPSSKRFTLEYLYENRNKFKKIVSYNEDTGEFEKNDVLDIIYNGIKPVYTISCRKYKRDKWAKNSYTLKCTDDHKLLTTDGWKMLKDMKYGDRFAVMKCRSKGKRAKKYISGKANFASICFKEYQYKCIFCDWKDASLDVNHLEGNRFTNNSPENLCFMCPNHHKMYTEGYINKEEIVESRKKYRLPQNDSIQWAEYLGKELVGEEKVYDISMNAPHHNFIAGGVVVHNCLNSSMEDSHGKLVSMTNQYIERKNGNEPVTYIDERVEQYLRDTYGIMIYQEQALAIARDLAGFNPVEAYNLQKAISKKLADKMAAIKDKFISGCLKNDVSFELATKLFDNIESSNRYSFCKGHSYSYGHMSAWTLFAKAHFPLHFFCASLKFANQQIDEDLDLLSEISLFDIPLKTPSISNLYSRFNIQDGSLHFGLSELKNVGKTETENFIYKICELEKELGKPAVDFSWYEFLVLISREIGERSMYNLISCGFLDETGVSRSRQLAEHKAIVSLTGKSEMVFIQENWSKYSDITELVLAMLEDGTPSKKGEFKYTVNGGRRKKVTSVLASLAKPATSFIDTTKWICDVETELMGTAISRSKTAHLERLGNLKCLDFYLGRGYTDIRLICEVVALDERIIKTGSNKGKKFANIKLKDTSGEIECTIFSREWEELRGDVILGNVLMVSGKRNQDKTLKIEEVKVL